MTVTIPLSVVVALMELLKNNAEKFSDSDKEAMIKQLDVAIAHELRAMEDAQIVTDHAVQLKQALGSP